MKENRQSLIIWLKDKIQYHIESGSQIVEFHNLLSEFRNSGGLREDAYNTLKDLRLNYSGDEAIDDKILEVMDIVSGFCSPSLKVWELE
jgi:hypothetical protein